MGDFSLVKEKTIILDRDTLNIRRKSKVIDKLKKSYIGSCLIIFYSFFFKTARKNVKNFENISQDINTVIIQDFASAYYLNKQKKFDRLKKVFVMHNDGNLLQMIYFNYPQIRGKRFGNFLEKIYSEIRQKSDAIVFVSNQSMQNFLREFPDTKDRCHYFPMGINNIPNKKVYDSKKLSLICVGSICKRKNQLSLIKAIEGIEENKVSLTLVGDGEMLEECKDYAKSHNLSNVSFTGGLPNEAVDDLLHNSDCFILASYNEGLPTVAVEAMRAGLPLILTDVGGCNELIHDNGFLIHPDVSEIKAAIQRMIDDLDRIKLFGEKSRFLFEKKYTIDGMVKNFCVLIEKLNN